MKRKIPRKKINKMHVKKLIKENGLTLADVIDVFEDLKSYCEDKLERGA